MGGAAALAAGDQGLPTYTNAEVLRVDVPGRTLVIRKASGVEQTVELDDNVAGFQDVRTGDQVIVGLRGEPGRERVSSIIRSKATSGPSGAVGPVAPAGDEAAAVRVSGAASAFFATRVAALAPQADRVDRVWSEFRQACDATVEGRYDAGREWFGLWDNQVRADLSQGFCRDLHNQVIALGQPVNAEMAVAEDTARRTLAPGEIREIRRRYSLEWDGWGRTPPKPLEK